MLATGVGDADDAVVLAEKLREALAAPIAVGGLALEVEASIGIALAPDHGDDVETLIRHADVAMYVSKDARTAPPSTAPRPTHHSRARLTLVGRPAPGHRARASSPSTTSRRSTLRDRRVAASRRSCAGSTPCTACCRPDEFIPLAEHTGLIRPLTLYVLDAALHQCAAWRSAGYDVAVAVNVTGRDLLDLRFPDEVAEAIARAGTAPDALELEITESTIMTDAARARTVLVQLSELGVRLAIDDFGTRPLVARLPEAPADRRAQDRPLVRDEHGRRQRRRRDRPLDHRPRPQPRPRGGRRGRRDRRRRWPASRSSAATPCRATSWAGPSRPMRSSGSCAAWRGAPTWRRVGDRLTRPLPGQRFASRTLGSERVL